MREYMKKIVFIIMGGLGLTGSFDGASLATKLSKEKEDAIAQEDVKIRKDIKLYYALAKDFRKVERRMKDYERRMKNKVPQDQDVLAKQDILAKHWNYLAMEIDWIMFQIGRRMINIESIRNRRFNVLLNEQELNEEKKDTLNEKVRYSPQARRLVMEGFEKMHPEVTSRIQVPR